MDMVSSSSSRDEQFCWRWFLDDPYKPVNISEDRLSVLFHPRRSNGCTAVRGDTPLLQHMEHWFQVKMTGPFYGQARMVGLGTKSTTLHSSGSKDYYPLIGRDGGSWGLNFTGKIHHDGNEINYTIIDPSQETIDIGVYYNSYYGTIVFSVNDKSLGVAFQNIPVVMDIYPMLCSSSRNSKMDLIYCHSSIVSLKSLCRGTIRLYLKNEEDINELPLPSSLMSYLMCKTYEHPKLKDYQSPNPQE